MRATLLPELLAKPRRLPVAHELDFFRVFAVCFGQPSHDFYAWLSGKEARSFWRQLVRDLRVEVKLPRRTNFEEYSAYEAAYIALFEVGVPEPPVPLLESAHAKRAVPQEIVLECVNFYDVLGLRPSGSAFPADHLVTQLEFLAAARYLRESQPNPENADPLRRLEREFLDRHLLNWLPIVQTKLDQLNPPLFPMLLKLLIAHLRAESHLLTAREP